MNPRAQAAPTCCDITVRVGVPYLSDEGDDPLRAVLVHVGQVDLVAEEHQPLAQLHGCQHHAVGRAAVLAVMIEGLQQQLGRGGAGEVQTHDLGETVTFNDRGQDLDSLTSSRGRLTVTDLHVRQGAEGAEESHGLSGPRRATQNQGFVLGQPGVQQSLVSHRVQRGHHHVGRRHLVRLYLDLRYLALPGLPLARDGHLQRTEKTERRRIIPTFKKLHAAFFF